MPFIDLMDDAIELWTEYRWALVAVCISIVVGVFIICCDNVECAILFVHILVIIYCGLWIAVVRAFNNFNTSGKAE